MFNLGISEIAFIAILALILVGPKQLPEVARILGRLLNDLRRTTNVFTDELRNQVQVDQRKIFDMLTEDDRKKRMEAHQQEMSKPSEASMAAATQTQQVTPPASATSTAAEPTPAQSQQSATENKPDDKKS
jgi:sec-independent protein translocase protein TatB